MKPLSRRAFCLVGGALAAASHVPAVAQSTQDPSSATPLGPALPPELYAAEGDWPFAQGNLAATRVASNSTFTADTIDRLEVLWEFPVEASTGYGGMTATPILSGNRVYLQDMLSNVFALDRETGELVWERRYDIPCIGPNGVAIAYGLIFGCLGDASRVFALDALTGEQQWLVDLSNNPGEGIDMAPLVYDSTVYISTVAGSTRSFNRGGARGVLFALDASTGATLWQFDTTTNNLWGSPRINSGGGLWYPPSVDNSGALYFGVGNAAPWPGTERFPNGGSRSAPNDYASSAVALDIATGAVRWHYNAAPLDLFDHDFQNTPILIDEGDGEASRPVAICSGKTGTVVAIERQGGGVLWERKVGIHQNDDLQKLPDELVEVYPGAWGGVLTPPAYSQERLFVPVVNHATLYTAAGYDKMSMFALTEATGNLECLHTADGSTIWSFDFDSPATAGATVLNDLVVTAGLDGVIRFVRATDGALVRTVQAAAGVNACPSAGGHHLIVAAAGPLVPSNDSETSAGEQSVAKVTCFTIGSN